MLQEYVFPQTVDEAVAFLQAGGGQARIIAGGTDLLLDMQEGKLKASCLVDITRIEELKKISCEDGVIRIGAAVTHNRVASSPIIREKATVLAEAASSVGSYQIRNSGTVVGNVVNAQPAADTAVALVALGAAAEIVSSDGVTVLPVESMYAGVGRSVVNSHSQLVTYVSFPAALKNQGSAFIRLEQRRALALPMLNVAAVVSLDQDKFEWVRIAMAPVGPGPVRAVKAEKLLKGAPATAEVIEEAVRMAVEDANPRDSALRGSRMYRLTVLPVLVRRALEKAVARASGSCGLSQ